MLFSANTYVAQQKFGTVDGIKAMIDAGFPALDMSFFAGSWFFTHEGDRIAIAKELRALADGHGVIFNQAHAPFGPTDVFYEKYFPSFAEMFECCSVLGVQDVVVHPLQHLRYYGNEEALFDINMEFYNSIKHFAEETGIRIAIENMWQRHPVNNHIVDSVCADPRELCRYYDTLGDSKNFTVCLDLGHVALCEREPEDAIRTIGHERLGALHVHDVDYV
ncbi:MAG: TIM barrel protein, partial [Clostridia bacterium]|nr:TIM barrel protein [Clostridia bacterium]